MIIRASTRLAASAAALTLAGGISLLAGGGAAQAAGCAASPCSVTANATVPTVLTLTMPQTTASFGSVNPGATSNITSDGPPIQVTSNSSPGYTVSVQAGATHLSDAGSDSIALTNLVAYADGIYGGSTPGGGTTVSLSSTTPATIAQANGPAGSCSTSWCTSSGGQDIFPAELGLSVPNGQPAGAYSIGLNYVLLSR